MIGYIKSLGFSDVRLSNTMYGKYQGYIINGKKCFIKNKDRHNSMAEYTAYLILTRLDVDVQKVVYTNRGNIIYDIREADDDQLYYIDWIVGDSKSYETMLAKLTEFAIESWIEHTIAQHFNEVILIDLLIGNLERFLYKNFAYLRGDTLGFRLAPLYDHDEAFCEEEIDFKTNILDNNNNKYRLSALAKIVVPKCEDLLGRIIKNKDEIIEIVRQYGFNANTIRDRIEIFSNI